MILSLALFSSLALSAVPPQVEIRVRVEREKSAMIIAGYGLRIAPPGGFIAASLPETKLIQAKVSRSKSGAWVVKWPQTKETDRFESPVLAVRGQLLRVGDEAVPYDLELIPSSKTGIDAVARLDLETYLAGVLPSEMPAAWPLEALKAQAVAARSFVLRTAFERRNRHYDVDSTIMDQVYKFLSEAKEHPEWREKIARAIADTRGQVLKDNRGAIAKAFYSADCGCQTEDPRFVWGKVESLQSVKDPTCGRRKPRQWDFNLSKVEVREKLTAAFVLPPDTTLRALQVAGKTPSGRVSNLIATLDVGGKSQRYMLGAQEFRRIFGFEKIRSTDFKLRWLGDRLEILGTGMGHAVGLCQTGAKYLAESGMGYEDILKVYYPKLKIFRGKPGRPASPRQSSADRRTPGLG